MNGDCVYDSIVALGRDGSNGDVPESSNKDGAKKKTAERPQKKPRTQPQEGVSPSQLSSSHLDKCINCRSPGGVLML